MKPAIQWIKQNIFWIGCFLLAATMIGSWVFSSMQLAAAQVESERDINKKLQSIKKVSGTKAEGADDIKAHPNQATLEGMDDEIDRTITSIVRAWKKRYEEQRSIFTWPEDVLGKETCDFFSKVDVPEKVSDPGQGFEKYRKAYYDGIPDFMDRICRDVGVNWQYDRKRIAEEQRRRREEKANGSQMEMGMNAMGMGPGMMGDDTSLIDEYNRYPVNWEEENQKLWQQKLTDFVGFDDHSGTVLYPTFMQANMLQQDLWLLEAMFKNIKEINQGSTSNDMSFIRTIDHIVFGREAISQLGTLTQVDARLAGAPAVVDPMAEMGVGMMGAPAGMIMGGPVKAEPGEKSSYHDRYVNPDLEPISATEVKAVLGGSALPEKNLELIVAKRVPFRVAVEMDERKINDFIAVCANSEFVFEISQLRVNRHLDFPGAIVFNGGAKRASSDTLGMMGGMMGGPGMGMDIDPSMYMEPGTESGGAAAGPVLAPTDTIEPTPVESRIDFMVSVEFYGVVKIYNPVRENFLRLAAGQEVVDETADPSLAPQQPIVLGAVPAQSPDEEDESAPPAAAAATNEDAAADSDAEAQ